MDKKYIPKFKEGDKVICIGKSIKGGLMNDPKYAGDGWVKWKVLIIGGIYTPQEWQSRERHKKGIYYTFKKEGEEYNYTHVFESFLEILDNIKETKDLNKQCLNKRYEKQVEKIPF